MGEVRELALKLIGPFLAVEEVVAKPPHDHHRGEKLIARIVIAAVESRLNDSGLVDGAQMQMRKVMSEGAVSKVALPEIGQLRGELFGLERCGVTPFIDLCADQVCARSCP